MLPPLLQARSHLAGAGIGATFFAVGGQDSSGAPTTDSQAYTDPCTSHFSDVGDPSTYFYTPVYYLACRSVIGGYNDGTFHPSANVTRGQLSKIIVGAQGWTLRTTGGPHFNDVAAASVFYPFVETAYAHGIISGYNDGTFRPSNSATRGQIAKIVYLALQDPLMPTRP